MLQPKRTKHRYRFRGRNKGKSTSGSRIDFGSLGLKSLDRGFLTANQIEAARKVITGITKRKAKLWIRVFPDKPITKKAPGAPMGAGKGSIDHWAAVIKPGKILFEISGVPDEVAIESLNKAGHKLPVRTKIVSKN